MTASELLAHLRRLEIRVWAEGDQLRLSAPKGTISPELRSELVERKAELIALLTSAPERSATVGDADRALRGTDRSYVAPLSSAQERMWFFEQLGTNTANQLNIGLQFDGELNIDALRQSLDALVRRHESLRTTFRSVNGSPVQAIAAMGTVVLSVKEAGTQTEVDAALTEEAGRTFDLERGPLLRALLLVLGPTRHTLLLTIHHVVCDGWSLGVLLRELAVLYEAAVRGTESSLRPLAMQYVDYARWQRDRLAGDALAGPLEYWRTQLRGQLPVLSLPTDHPRPAEETHRGERITVTLSAVAVPELHALARREQATLFMVLLAAFTALLSRYAAQEDVIVGTPVAGRGRPEWEELIGLFVNTLVLRIDAGGDPTFLELLRRARDTAIDGYANQDVPFERLVEELRPARDLSRNPVFQVMFDLQNMTPPPPFLGLEMRPVPIDRGAAQLDLTLSILTYEGRLHTQWEYNTSLFDRATIERLARHFEQLLLSAVTDPVQRLSQLSMLTAAETEWAVHTLNATDAPFPADRTLHELVEQQVDRSPDACAVEFESETLTYRELDDRANCLAAELRELGVGPDVLVGVCMERSLEMVVSLLAVLKAGGAYVPLDPDYPEDRLRFMVGEIQAPVVLCQARLASSLAGVGGRVFAVDAEADRPATRRGGRLPAAAAPGNLAYVIYTSGSTGRPKGAMIPHRGIVNRLWWMQQALELTADDRVLQKTPYSFDVSVWEFFWPLLAGARLVVARPNGHRDPRYLEALIQRAGITTVHFVPSMLRAFIADADMRHCTSLRRVICSGEALTLELEREYFTRLHAPLYNLYGPTEASVDVTWWECRRDETRTVVPIGRPIANTQMYVLDRAQRPVPIGVHGELYIGGVGVGNGYLKRPELTAERFVADPFRPGHAARLYRTGDRARLAPGGEIEFLGRFDFQIKLRGFRIELGEVETALAAHPSVRDAVVLAREATPGDLRLVAYVTFRPGEDLTASDVRRHLRKELPEYMIPSIVVPLDTIPLTASGKVNRAALPDPLGAGVRPKAAYVPPATGAEKVMAEIWREILAVDRVSAEDNFFELGGHSLLSMRVVASVEQQLGWRMDPRVLFFQSLRQVAAGASAAGADAPQGRSR